MGGRRAARVAPFCALALTGILLGGCSLLSDASNAYVAPVGVLPQTDVVVATNLQTALTSVQTAVASGAPVSAADMPAYGFVSGPSDGPSVTSFDSPVPGEAVLASYNTASRDCLGIIYFASSGGVAVLGKTGPGTFYFTEKNTPTDGCAASLFAAEPAVPSGWPAGDPSSSSFLTP